MSMRYAGVANLSFISGIRLCPQRGVSPRSHIGAEGKRFMQGGRSKIRKLRGDHIALPPTEPSGTLAPSLTQGLHGT